MARWLKLLVFACSLLVFASTSPGAEKDHLTYSEFVAAVEAGNVKSVSVDPLSSITGTRLIDGQERLFQSHGQTGSANDVLLMRLLNEKGVEVKMTPVSIDRFTAITSIVALVMLLTPILILLIVIRISMKVNRLRKELKALNDYWADDPNAGNFE